MATRKRTSAATATKSTTRTTARTSTRSTATKPAGKSSAAASRASSAKQPAAPPARRAGNGEVDLTRVEGSIDLRAADLPLGADATDELGKAAPAFGAVLKSIGLAVAASQASLDKGVIQSVEALRKKKIDVVTDVITELDDDGQPKKPTVGPDNQQSNLRTANVSVLNFFTPTIHEWKHVALSMDLSVGELDSSQGVKFSNRQASVRSNVGVHWGFFGWFASGGLEAGYSRTDVQVNRRQETDWAQGTVRVDAELGPRRTTSFPVPGRVERGPTLVFMPQAISRDEAAGTRSIPVKVVCRKGSGEPNPAKPVQVSAAGLVFSGATQTDTNGEFTVTATKPLSSPTAKHLVTARLGSLIRTFELTF